MIKTLFKKNRKRLDTEEYVLEEAMDNHGVGEYKEVLNQLERQNFAIIGTGGTGKTTFLQTIQLDEDKDISRFMISYHKEEIKSSELYFIQEDFCVNPFTITINNSNEAIMRVIKFFKLVSEIPTVSARPLSTKEEGILQEFLQRFYQNVLQPLVTISVFNEYLEQEFKYVVEKLDLQMKTFSTIYEKSNLISYEFYKLHQHEFEFMNNNLERLDLYKKIQSFINYLEVQGVIPYIDGPDNVHPCHRRITLIPLEKVCYEFRPLLSLLLLDKIHAGKEPSIIYIDDFESLFYQKAVLEELSTYLALRIKDQVTYRIAGGNIPLEVLINVENLIAMMSTHSVAYELNQRFNIPMDIAFLGNKEAVLLSLKDSTKPILFKMP